MDLSHSNLFRPENSLRIFFSFEEDEKYYRKVQGMDKSMITIKSGNIEKLDSIKKAMKPAIESFIN